MAPFDRKTRLHGSKKGYDHIRSYTNGDLFFPERVGFTGLKYFSWS